MLFRARTIGRIWPTTRDEEPAAEGYRRLSDLDLEWIYALARFKSGLNVPKQAKRPWSWAYLFYAFLVLATFSLVILDLIS